MSWPFMTRRLPPVYTYAGVTFDQCFSFALATIAGFALTINAFVESFHSARLGVVLGVLFLFHLLRYPRVLVCREFAMYAIFVGYMYSSLLWTADVNLAMNTLGLAQDFVVVLVLFGSLVIYHDLRAVLAGTLAGFLIAAAIYTVTSGFPFVFPVDFSYNAAAQMYLFGLFLALVIAWNARSALLPLSIGLILLVHIAATTSIKTNLGILLGVMAASLMYFRYFVSRLRGNAILIIALAGMLALAVASSDALVQRLQAGVDRVALGVEILNARENLKGYSGFGERERWANEGLKGWAQNPIAGKGVEAFRYEYGITSHSTPADLLYNSGLIGFALFYGIFISMAWRLFRARDEIPAGLGALMVGALVCYPFMTLSGTMHYNPLLAVFIAIGTALLRKHQRQSVRFGIPPLDSHL